MTEWIKLAIEQKHPKLSVALAWSVPYFIVESHALDRLLVTRRFMRTDINEIGLS